MLFKKNAQVRQDYLKHCPNWTDENGRCRVLTELNMKTGMRLQNQRMELYQAHAGCVTNCKMRNKAFQEDCARNCQEVEELRRILLYRGLEELDNWREMNFLRRRKKVIYSESAPGSISGHARHGEFLERCKRTLWSWNCEQLWIITRFESTQECSESKRNDWPRLLLAVCHTELTGNIRTRLLQANHREHSAEILRFGHRLLADRSQLIQAKLWNRARYWEKNHGIVQYQLFALPGTLRPGTVYIVQEELILKIVWWNIREIKSRNCISTNSLTHRPSSSGRPIFKTEVCWCSGCLAVALVGSKKWRWPSQWPILWRRSLLKGMNSLIVRCLLRR